MPSSGGWYDLSTQGCLTQRLADAALYLDTFGDFGDDFRSVAGRSPGQLRIGVTTVGAAATRMAPIEPAVHAGVRRAADVLADLGQVEIAIAEMKAALW